MDHHSYANFDAFQITHVHLQWKVIFDCKQITGKATLSILPLTSGTNTLILDARSLHIAKIQTSNLTLAWSEEKRHFGSAIHIKLPDSLAREQFELTIEYETAHGSQCLALDWICPAGKSPIVYSQCQAIHARSLFPCQDTPAIKQTYSASVECTGQPQMTVLMSALAAGTCAKDENGVFHFAQPIPIPSYLFAICCADIQAQELGKRCCIYAEGSIFAKAVQEFEHLEELLASVEGYFGMEYQWTKYSLLILPSSFPYGGMENPNVTFITPTLVAGDKSMVSVVVHEIVHSWTGNSITNASWEHFWLNEGFTKFIERKVLGKLYGESFRQLSHSLGYELLEDAVAFMRQTTSHLTKLVPNLQNVDPDDAFSRIPYEKGALLLYYLEEQVGGPSTFDDFIRKYVQQFYGKTVRTEDFVSFFCSCFPAVQVDWNSWLYAEGMPSYRPVFDNSLKMETERLVGCLAKGETPSLKALHPTQLTLVLKGLLSKAPFHHALLNAIDTEYAFGSVERYNVEVQLNWLLICLKSKCAFIIPKVLAYVASVGRMQYIRPLYRALYEWIPQVAWDSYYKNAAFYHPIVLQVLQKELFTD